jgi:hypothetical protein
MRKQFQRGALPGVVFAASAVIKVESLDGAGRVWRWSPGLRYVGEAYVYPGRGHD